MEIDLIILFAGHGYRLDRVHEDFIVILTSEERKKIPISQLKNRNPSEYGEWSYEYTGNIGSVSELENA